MKRSMEKAIAEYNRRFCEGNKTTGAFYYKDLLQIKDLSQKDGHLDAYELVSNALQAGFMIGYRTAERHCRERKKACQ